jgi:2-oxoisovalerate dehydrogenase E1 component
MQRYPAYDPPEYLDWRPDPSVMAEFYQTIVSSPDRLALVKGLRAEDHLRLYKGMLRNRLHDIGLKRWVRQGVISKAWLGTGEEATTIGAVHALQPKDVVGPMIRNAGACHEMGMSLADMFRAYLGTADSPSGGRDVHIGDLGRGVLAPISMVGSLVPVTAGCALAFKMRGQDQVALTWVGDGSTRTTAFHEGMVTARAFRLPFIVVVQNNQIALGTPVAAHSRGSMDRVAALYDAFALRCDGNHVLDVFTAVSQAAARCREGGGPAIVTAHTFRMAGHATHDEGESRNILPPDLFQHWGKRDPIGMYEAFLAGDGSSLGRFISPEELARAESTVAGEVSLAAEEALRSREENMPAPDSQRLGVLAAS